MNKLPALLNIGYSKKTFGYQGEISISVKEEFNDYIDDIKFIFIQIDGNHVPFKIEYVDEKSEVIIKLEDISSSEDAQKLVNKSLYIEESYIPEDELAALVIQGNLEGYKVIADGILIGTIASIEELPSQLLAHVKNENSIHLIPIVEDFIQNINTKSKIVYLTLPEGLLNL